MNIKGLVIILVVLFVSGCVRQPITGVGAGEGAAYTPVVDGPQDEAYYRYLRECRQLVGPGATATKVRVGRRYAAVVAVTGGVLGALVGSIEGSDEALIGGLIGATVVGATSAADTAEEVASSGKTIITNCMRGREHNVLL